MDKNLPTGETFSEGSDVPPSEEAPVEDITGEEDGESPVQEYFDSLDETEKKELCDIVRAYDKANKKAAPKGNFDLKGMMPEDDNGD